MEKDAIEHLEQALEESQFQLGHYLKAGFKLWNTKPAQYIAFILVLMLIGLGLGMIPFIGPVLNGLFISSCLTLGGYLYSDRVANDQSAEFGNFFDGFQDIPKIIVLNLILFALAILILIPFVMSVGVSALMGSVEDSTSLSMPFENVGWGPILLILPAIYAYMLTAFTIPMIGFYGLSPVNALQYSAKFVHKHALSIFLFFMICFIIIFVGILGFFIGIFVTGSMIYALMYVLFSDLTDLDGYRTEEIEDDSYTGATLDDFR